MKKLSINEIAEIVEGATFNLDLDEQVSIYPVISSKEANKDTFFAAFEGTKVDGHDFADEDIKNGARCHRYSQLLQQRSGADDKHPYRRGVTRGVAAHARLERYGSRLCHSLSRPVSGRGGSCLLRHARTPRRS